MVSIALRRLGLQDEIGILVAVSDERIFHPDKRVILDVAVNQRWSGSTRLERLNRTGQISQELDLRVTQRTRDL